MNEKILIVDDEVRLRKLLTAYLKKEGYQIIEAGNGLEALNQVRSNKVDLVILDVMMPVMDGWTACGEIRKISQVPIIMLTARERMKINFLGSGLELTIMKPNHSAPKCLWQK